MGEEEKEEGCERVREGGVGGDGWGDRGNGVSGHKIRGGGVGGFWREEVRGGEKEEGGVTWWEGGGGEGEDEGASDDVWDVGGEGMWAGEVRSGVGGAEGGGRGGMVGGGG